MTRSDRLTIAILQGLVEGKRMMGRPKKRWTDNIAERTGKLFVETSIMAHGERLVFILP